MEIPETDVLRGVGVGVVLISALQILKVLAIMITRALFPKGSGDGDNCFSTAGHQLFAANLKYLRRELENPDNADLVRYWQRADPDKMHENLTRDGHEDLTSAAAAIDPDAGWQTSGVFATAQHQVSDIFVGDFAASDAFSVAQYMTNP